jgi:FMNH2-dependent dimethyl sulfone monooxygenase
MRYGVWTPLPHTIRPEPVMNEAMRESAIRGLANGPDKAFAFAVDMICRAEDLGYETTLIAERWMGTDHPAWMLTAALAALTHKIELMVAVHPGILNPQVVAKFAASLDRISGGRAALNIVNGWWKEEFDTFSNGALEKTDEERYRRMDEFIQVIRGLWMQEKLDFHGQFYTVANQGLPLKPVQLPNPPIYAASRHDPGKDVIARGCEYWFVDYVPDRRQWRSNVDLVAAGIADMRTRAAAHGRDLGFGMSCHVICADTMEEAERSADALEEHGKTNNVAFISAKALGPGLVGTPEVIAERIELFEAAGVGTLMMHFHPMIESMENFARKIMPLVRKQTAPVPQDD